MKKKIFLYLSLLAIVLGIVGYGVLNYTYSNGVRSGKLVKISKKGMALKTYEGTLDLGSGDQLTWNFSVHDPEVGESLIRLTGKEIKLEYRELLFKIFYATKYDVVSWEKIRSDGSLLLCRLVNIMRESKIVVDRVRRLIQSNDPSLLALIRDCQD